MRRIWPVLILVLIIGAVYSWLNAPEWLEEWNSDHQQMVELQRESGLQAGSSADQQQCLEVALSQLEQCQASEYECTVGGGMFLKSCWSVSQQTADFCNGVPALNEKPSEDDKAWYKDRCFELGVQASGCKLFLRQQQQLCSTASNQ